MVGSSWVINKTLLKRIISFNKSSVQDLRTSVKEYCKKGDIVGIKGRLQSRVIEKDKTIEISVINKEVEKEQEKEDKKEEQKDQKQDEEKK